ncbi:hypothetical protein TeGR_g12729, partial [Tetraparma gracilis]
YHEFDVGVSCTFLAPGDECEECAAGKFGATAGVAACTSCAAGSYSTVGAASCQQCEAGKASATPGAATCTECVAGKFSDTTGVAACTSCAAGSYSTVGAARCEQCEAGKASATPGAAACTECASGTYANAAIGATRCVECAAGSYITAMGSVFADDCQLCEVGKASATPAATSAAACEECVAGKYSDTTGVVTCTNCTSISLPAASAPGSTSSSDCACPAGETPLADLSGCKALLLCADDEFLSSEGSSEEQVCVKCDNLTSIAMVVGSFLTFVAITYYVSDKVTIKSTMVQVKGMTTYFQCAQLTTLVDIQWPRIALVLPFAIPFGDGACLTNQVGWTQQHSFFVFVYGALLVAFVIRMRGNRFGKGSIERKETYERLVLFVLICYSPLVQNAATMQRCITDPDFGLVLEADPRVSCETSFLRVTVIIHALAIVAIVGIGLPYFVLRTTYNLRQADRLSESNIYVGLYEWYSPARPYWEAVLLAKKFVLIMASTTVIKDPLAQALIGTATNLGYMILLETKRPMLMQPSQLLRGKNLFHMMERAASTASLIGSIIAVLGAASPGLVGVLGVLFAFCNLIYATYVVGFFFFEEKKIKNRTKVVPDEEDRFKMSAWDSH